ncbi:O-methyltransferase family protein [Burkholderia humptydooensis]|nr:O-methyltransferase family protein [Burkholderia sp. 2002721687]ALX45644.1 hypothetical protein AQ610_24680 [Burkholderia humptydooensis]EIP86598.1 putative acyl-CoA transferase/carnitine dehydratase [Burkholderia humptydooensis MSMB43]
MTYVERNAARLAAGAPVSDALLQAATGMTGWHARAARAWRPLGVDCVSTLGASPAALSQCLADAALFAMSQYLAMDHAGQPAQQPRDANDRPPPFESGDGMRFELEALDPDAWGRFWRRAAAGADDIAAGWRPFMLRYTQARAPLPAGLFRAAARLDYASLGAIARETGTYVSAVRDAAALRDDPRDARRRGRRRPCAASTGRRCATRVRAAHEFGVEARARFVGGDLFDVEIPGQYDLVIMSQILHLFDEDACRRLLARACSLLAPGGRIAVCDFMISDAPPASEPVPRLFAAQMLGLTQAGDCYPVAAVRALLAEQGLVDVMATPLKGVPVHCVTGDRAAG